MILIIAIYFLFALSYLIYRRKHFLSPSSLFVASQIIMFAGILGYADFGNKSDIKLIFIYVVALVFFIFGTLVKPAKVTQKYYKTDKNDFSTFQTIVIVVLVALSIGLCSYLFAKNGGNAFVLAVKSIFSDGESNIVSARSEYNKVSGIGYISQFRGVILPLLNILLVINRKRKKLRTLGFILLPFTVLFLLGTGQRGQFFIIACIVLLNVFLQGKYLGFKIKWLRIVVAGIIAFALFSILSVANNRVSSGDTNIVVGVFNAFIKRIMNDNQSCAVIGFRYIDSLNVCWGRDWAMSFLDLLPGKNSYISMESQIFNLIYGSTNGTSPPCIWGSAYYNFGYFGVTLFPFALGFLYEKCYRSFLDKPKSQLSICMYSGLFVIMGFWIASTPMYLINDGFVTILILLFILDRITFSFQNGFEFKRYALKR